MLRAWTTVAMSLLEYCPQSFFYGETFNQTYELLSKSLLLISCLFSEQILFSVGQPLFCVSTKFCDIFNSCVRLNVSSCLLWVNLQVHELLANSINKLLRGYPKNILQSCWKPVLKTNKVESPGVFIAGPKSCNKLLVFFLVERIFLLFSVRSVFLSRKLNTYELCKIVFFKNGVYHCCGLSKLRFSRWLFLVGSPCFYLLCNFPTSFSILT